MAIARAKYLVIVESPSKIKTIKKILGNDYVIEASFGHICDLPKNRLGIDVDNNYEPEYAVTPDKSKVVKHLKSLIGKETIVYLSSDDDREGNVIAYTLKRALKLKEGQYKRVIFHEITKPAITEAFKNPKDELDMGSVNAGITRRMIDRIVGYKLSPILWKTVKYGLSAGRVQSAALLIVCNRENEIQSFNKEEFWKLKLNVNDYDIKFIAELSKYNNKPIKVTNKDDAYVIKDKCDRYGYVVTDIVNKVSYRKPVAPFTTSTLQQIASSKLHYNVKVTMELAQKLYESGYITYMRTDSTILSKSAIDDIRSNIVSIYGKEYLNDKVNIFKNKGNSQEAHEAIRPTSFTNTPDVMKSKLTHNGLFKLYKLIWERAIATQMKPAEVANTIYYIDSGMASDVYRYIAKGTKIIFKGYLEAYNNTTEDKLLPVIDKGTKLIKTKLIPEQNFTKPPSRYTEATLVKALETAGVGRPSTYASTISTIMNRKYVVVNKEKKLEPTVIGMSVNEFLTKNFGDIININFTSEIESELDNIAKGKVDWHVVIDKFYKKFIKEVLKKQDIERVQYSKSKVLGKDEVTGEDIYLNEGQYGVYITIGKADKEKGIKPIKTSTVPNNITYDDVTLELAKHYLKVPRELGKYNDKVVKVGNGKFGSYIQYNGKYYSIKEPDDVYEIELGRAIELIDNKDKLDSDNTLWSDSKYVVMKGKYGPYIKPKGKGKAVKLPNDITDVNKLTSEIVNEIYTNNSKKRKNRRKR